MYKFQYNLQAFLLFNGLYRHIKTAFFPNITKRYGMTIPVYCYYKLFFSYHFPLGSNMSEARKLKTTAAAIPPAADLSPPVNIPKNPALSTSLITPLARL